MFASRALAPPGLTTVSQGRSDWADYGWHRVSSTCLALQGLLLGSSLVLYRVTHIDVRWSSDVAFLVLMGALAALWAARLPRVSGVSTVRLTNM